MLVRRRWNEREVILRTALSLVLVVSLGWFLVAGAAADSSQGILLRLEKRPATVGRIYAAPRRHGELALQMGLASPSDGRNRGVPGGLPVNPLAGGIVNVGEYYVAISVDNQTVHVQIDTGSTAIAFPLRQCKNCLKGDRRVNLSNPDATRILCTNASICKPSSCNSLCGACSVSTRACCSPVDTKACGFRLVYGDGSFAIGALHVGRLTLTETGLSVYPAYFGGILLDSSSFEHTDVDGIWGLAYPTLACNPSCVPPVFDTMVRTGVVPRDMFTLCLTDTAGALVLGGAAGPEMRKNDYAWVPMTHRAVRTYYEVGVESIKFGPSETSVLPEVRSAIVDSGTTLIVISSRSFGTLREYLQSRYCDQVPGLCGEKTWLETGRCATLSDAHIARLPPITVQLTGGVELRIPPDMYMLRAQMRGQMFRCFGIQHVTGDLVDGRIILGDTFMRAYVTVFDRENSRIGFAAAAENCGMPAVRGNGVLYTLPNATGVQPKQSGQTKQFTVFGYSISRVAAEIIVLVLLLAAVALVVTAIFRCVRSRHPAAGNGTSESHADGSQTALLSNV
ncbi:hypothetical protein CCYA_CCYA08G2347 [Cyanidiococcus yangmingshanensis]|nr:hypothetical protein CCYA_CCYA08G2347 [Cyanidiococcus yangmingshanensis]